MLAHRWLCSGIVLTALAFAFEGTVSTAEACNRCGRRWCGSSYGCGYEYSYGCSSWPYFGGAACPSCYSNGYPPGPSRGGYGYYGYPTCCRSSWAFYPYSGTPEFTPMYAAPGPGYRTMAPAVPTRSNRTMAPASPAPGYHTMPPASPAPDNRAVAPPSPAPENSTTVPPSPSLYNGAEPTPKVDK